MKRVRDSPPKMPRWVKISGIVVLVIVLGFLILKAAGIGGQHGPMRHLGSGATDTQTAPTGSGAKASGANATGIGGPADASEATRVVEIRMADNAFEPSTITASRGETLTFVVTNLGQAGHEFVIGDSGMQQQRAMMRSHMGSMTPHDSSNAMHLEPGDTKELTWRFGNEPFEYACHEAWHYDGGMRGQITIA